MARGRMVNKSISLSEQVNGLSCDSAQLLFTWLIPHLDQNGCMYGDAHLVKSIVFPRKNHSTKRIEGWLHEMEQRVDSQGFPLIKRYVIGETCYLHCPGFQNSQIGIRLDREPPTNIPLPPFPLGNGQMTENIPHNDGSKTEPIPTNDGSKTEPIPTNDGKHPAQIKVKESKLKERKLNESKANFNGLEDYKKKLRSRFPNLDFDAELEKCKLYWGEGKRQLKRPKLALFNWMQKAEEIRMEKAPAGGTGGGRGVPKKYTPAPREEE